MRCSEFVHWRLKPSLAVRLWLLQLKTTIVDMSISKRQQQLAVTHTNRDTTGQFHAAMQWRLTSFVNFKYMWALWSTSKVPLKHLPPSPFFRNRNTKQSLASFGCMVKKLAVTEWHQIGHVDVKVFVSCLTFLLSVNKSMLQGVCRLSFVTDVL